MALATLDLMLDGWNVIEAELPPGVRGQCDWSARTILIRADLAWPQMRVTLTHEWMHAERGPFPRWMEAREEAAINRAVARVLLPLHPLGEALAWALWPEEAADELGVTLACLRTRLTHLHPSERAYLTRRLEHHDRH